MISMGKPSSRINLLMNHSMVSVALGTYTVSDQFHIFRFLGMFEYIVYGIRRSSETLLYKIAVACQSIPSSVTIYFSNLVQTKLDHSIFQQLHPGCDFAKYALPSSGF